MAKWLRSIQEDEGEGEDFKDKAAEWKAKTTHNTFATFKQFLINRNLVVRDRDRHKKTKAKDTGFHSANSAREIEDYLTNTMAMAIKELVVATEETTNLAVGTTPKPPVVKTSNENLAASLITLIKAVAELKKSKKP